MSKSGDENLFTFPRPALQKKGVENTNKALDISLQPSKIMSAFQGAVVNRIMTVKCHSDEGNSSILISDQMKTSEASSENVTKLNTSEEVSVNFSATFSNKEEEIDPLGSEESEKAVEKIMSHTNPSVNEDSSSENILPELKELSDPCSPDNDEQALSPPDVKVGAGVPFHQLLPCPVPSTSGSLSCQHTQLKEEYFFHHVHDNEDVEEESDEDIEVSSEDSMEVVELSALSSRFPYLSLPDCTPSYILEPVEMFVPEPSLLDKLEVLGIPRLAAIKALFWTGNTCIHQSSNWYFEQADRDMETPLEKEVSMLLAELEVRNQEAEEDCMVANIKRHVSVDSGVWVESQEKVDDEESVDPPRVVIIQNSTLNMSTDKVWRLWLSLISQVMEHVVEEMGEEEIFMWEECGQLVEVVGGSGSRHLQDLRLGAESLGLVTVEKGADMWDHVQGCCFRELEVLIIWGEEDSVEKVVGRLPPVAEFSDI